MAAGARTRPRRLARAVRAPGAASRRTPRGSAQSWLFVTIFAFAIFVLVEGLLIAFISAVPAPEAARASRTARRSTAPRSSSSPGRPARSSSSSSIAAFVFIELPGIKDIPDATAGEEQLEIKVTGRQFYWQYEYPNGVIAIDQLRAPVGRARRARGDRARLRTSSTRWWIPALGGKIDAIPGGTNETWFQATNGGDVHRPVRRALRPRARADARVGRGACPSDEFDAWLDERRAEQDAGSGELGQETVGGRLREVPRARRRGRHRPAHRRLAHARRDPEALANARPQRRGARCPPVGAGWTDEQIAALADYLKENPPSGS